MSALDAYGDNVYLKVYILARLAKSPQWVKNVRWFKDCSVLVMWSYREVAIYVTDSDLRLMSYVDQENNDREDRLSVPR